mmetsp:Transcript_4231/g.11935  ORF Transcript_4231/g.11935 Transcript_4231/m.11935 type:complete len:206 (-) Transcript_4231:442-1059(-)
MTAGYENSFLLCGAASNVSTCLHVSPPSLETATSRFVRPAIPLFWDLLYTMTTRLSVSVTASRPELGLWTLGNSLAADQLTPSSSPTTRPRTFFLVRIAILSLPAWSKKRAGWIMELIVCLTGPILSQLTPPSLLRSIHMLQSSPVGPPSSEVPTTMVPSLSSMGLFFDGPMIGRGRATASSHVLPASLLSFRNPLQLVGDSPTL